METFKVNASYPSKINFMFCGTICAYLGAYFFSYEVVILVFFSLHSSGEEETLLHET